MKVLALLLALAGLAPMAASAGTMGSVPRYSGYNSYQSYSNNNFTITRYQAARIARNAVGGGQVQQIQFDNYPRRMWQVEVLTTRGQYEVDVSARTGKVLAIVFQGAEN